MLASKKEEFFVVVLAVFKAISGQIFDINYNESATIYKGLSIK